MDPKELLASAFARVDRRHPGVVRFVLGLRWGGLRTVRPDPAGWVALGVVGGMAGLGARTLSGRVLGRPRPSGAVAVVGGQAALWFGLWRWDTRRWRHSRVALVVDLPPGAEASLIEELAAEGVAVERWAEPDRAGGRIGGLLCRASDVRRVNRAVDDVASAAAGGGGGPDRRAGADRGGGPGGGGRP